MGRQINVETAGRMRNMIHEPEFWLPSMEKNRKVEFKDGVFQSNVKIACPKRQENTDCLGNQPLGLRNLTLCFGKSPEGLLAARFFFLSRDPQPAPSQPPASPSALLCPGPRTRRGSGQDPRAWTRTCLRPVRASV